MLEFATVVKNLEKDYSENDGWPTFMDDFVTWMKGNNGA